MADYNAEGVRKFQPGVAATPGPGRDKNRLTLKVLANCEQLIRQLLRSFTLNEHLIPGVGSTPG